MTEKQQNASTTKKDNSVVLRVPKPNLQIIVLALIAVITLFQTFQLVIISSKATTAKVSTVAAPAAGAAPANTGGGSGVPKSQVGGC